VWWKLKGKKFIIMEKKEGKKVGESKRGNQPIDW